MIERKYFSLIDLIVYIAIFFVCNILGAIIGQIMIEKYSAEYGLENITKLSYIPIFLLIVITSTVYRRIRCTLTESPCRFIGNGRLSANAVLLGVVLMVAVSVVIDPLSHFFKEDMAEYIKVFTTGNMWVTLFVTVLIAPILEEIFFRGIILKDISVSWGPRWGIFISSVIFSLLHFNVIQAIPAFLMGLVMGYIYISTRRGLTNVIFVHIINNLAASVSLFWGFGEVSVWERYLSDGLWQKLVYGVSLLLVMLLVVRIVTITGKSLIKKVKNV